MNKTYSHTDHEDKVYKLWQEQDVFSPIEDPDVETFTIIMPPPNANDSLHVGHGMFITLEDIMIRYQRMLGKATLWLPGTDHAGIETQFLFEKKLAKEKKSRFDYDRETLYQMIWDYVQENSDTAVVQIKKLGASADWGRFKFMLEPEIVQTILETFVKLHQDKLVYRDLRLVQYCTKCGTSFSELEVVHQDQVTKLYYVKYPLADNPEEHITIATTRPEPIFVDTHLAVHPDNPKTKHLIGKKVLNPLTDEPMDIIADDFVDPEFGTGIVKLTPAHDAADFEVAQKHNLPIIPAINVRGKIVDDAAKFAGLSVANARQAAVEELTQKGLIEKIDDKYQNRAGTCYRCSRILEPLPLPQFFVKVKPLVEPIIESLDKGEITVHGAGHDKILRHWLENLKDWNISRQIVWGIRLPVWYRVSDKRQATRHKLENPNLKIQVSFVNKDKELVRGLIGELLGEYSFDEIKSGLQSLDAPSDADFVVSLESPGDEYIQETDTFDTWFSSAQWPFSTLQNTKDGDFDRFYPTQVMETGYDILPFWVMRMLFMGKYMTGKLPFSTVYLHGLIRDQKGQKMSKSKGNVINPLEVVDKYGADALRMALVIRSSAGLDKNVGEADFKAMRNLTNKIWNAARFVVMSAEDKLVEVGPQDRSFETDLTKQIKEITKQLNSHKLGFAAETIYNNFWHWYCDEQIEAHKQGQISTQNLVKGLRVYLKLLHPFVPFVTEAVFQEIKQQLRNKPEFDQLLQDSTLATSSWPR